MINNIKMTIKEVQTPNDDIVLSYFKCKNESPERRLARWFVNGEVGASSKTLASWCMSIKPRYESAPSDQSDRMRCVLVLELIPEWQKYLLSIPYDSWNDQAPLVKDMLIERGSWIEE